VSATHTVAECHGCDIPGASGEVEVDEAKVNAHLIAAAPELLAALEIAVEYLHANRPKGDIRKNFSAINEHENGVMKPARAAISKAKGAQ
jgi:hypothetical protein